jgi:anti-sigma B factor antagonist
MTDHLPTVGRTSLAGIVTVRCTGELDLASAPRVRAELLAPIRDGVRGVVADLTATTFCDSTIFSVLFTAHRAASDRGVPFAVAAAYWALGRPLEILGLDLVLPLHPGLAEARAAVTGEPVGRRAS